MATATIEDVKERYDLLIEVERDLGPGRRSGRWYLFHCPFPGHARGDQNPSLSVTPDNGRYFCFTCGAGGDVITWLRDYRELAWGDILGRDLPPFRSKPRPKPEPAPSGPPPDLWQKNAWLFVNYCEEQLWEGAGEPVFMSEDDPDKKLTPLDYLQQARGLTEETIRRYRLGYNPNYLKRSPESWGMDPARYKRVCLYPGITIPRIAGGQLWGVNVRRPYKESSKRYRNVNGSVGALFGADDLFAAEIILLTEGEFDCMIAQQEIGPHIGVATLGSNVASLDVSTWGPYLMPARAIVAAFDSDGRSGQGLAKLLGRSAQIHSIQVPVRRPGDKDITDYVLAGGELWPWLKYHLTELGILEALDVLHDTLTEM